MIEPLDYIYADLELNRSTDKALSQLMKTLFVCKGQIICMGSITNGFPVEKFSYWQTFYKLRFDNNSDLQNFVNAGYDVTEPELITGC